MNVQSLIAQAQSHFAKRRQFNQLAAEINGLSNRDLADIRGDRTEMLRHAYRKVYG